MDVRSLFLDFPFLHPKRLHSQTNMIDSIEGSKEVFEIALLPYEERSVGRYVGDVIVGC